MRSSSSGDERGRPLGMRWIAVSWIGIVALSAVLTALTMRGCAAPTALPPASKIEVRAAPNVVLAIRDLARLETASFHMERVVEMTVTQTKLWGLTDSEDAILLVAVGDVTAGVDLAKIRDDDVKVDWTHKRVRVKLAPVEVFSAALDSDKTHVHSRKTGALADRREDLETLARRDAEQNIKAGALAGGLLTRAQTNAERTVRSLLRTLGFDDIQITWSPK